jgi:hypothetical protein
MRYATEGIGPSSSPELKQHTAALIKVHKRMETIAKTKANPHFRSKYADFATICNELVELLTSEGFAMPTYSTGWYGPEMGWCCHAVLKHESGEWSSTVVPLLNLPRKTKDGDQPPDMQGLGSAKTYAKRYALLDLVGAWVGEEDDDGNRSAGRYEAPESRSPRTSSEQRSALDQKSMAYLQGALNAISEADSKEHAKKHLDMVRLRAKEKAIPAEVFHRAEAEFKKVWEQEVKA